jgi:dipeptidyl aminopeptidase/acylaminoacyl peptidase
MIGAEISPDGSRIAAVKYVPRALFDEENGGAWTEIHVIDVKDGTVLPFVTGEVNVSRVAWRPDGAAISFVSKRDGAEHEGLYVIPLAGGEAQRVVEFESDVLGYSWSPDGSAIAFIAKPPVSDEKKELEDQGFNQEIYEEDWRPRAVWIADPSSDGEEPERVDLAGSAYQVRWNPNGHLLAVALAPRPLVDDEYMYQKVHVVSAITGEVVGVVDHAAKLSRVEWSPDGKRLAMLAGVDMNDPMESSLFVAAADGGSATNLTDGWPGHVNRIAWRDESTLLFLGDTGVTSDLFTVPASGAEKPRARGMETGNAVMTRMSISNDGATVGLIGESPFHPGEVFTADLKTTTPRRLTDSNPWLAEVAFGRQEVVRFAARDGLELEGILVFPVDYQKDTKYPLVLVVHGGPEAHYRNGWMNRYSRPAHILASRGFAVFFPNYRGSTGRGVEFSKLSQGDPAGAEFDDLVDAVDHLVDMGLVDPDRVGITGGSYGGYATAWGATKFTDRFAAGVMFVGISNKMSKVGTTDIPDEEYYVHALKRVYDDVPFFLERSPISYVKGAKTPLLIMHGEDDPRVSVTQSKELYRALKILDQAPVRLVMYPGEGHGNRKTAARYDYMLRAIRWMEHYLKGDGGEPPAYELDYKSADYGWEE